MDFYASEGRVFGNRCDNCRIAIRRTLRVKVGAAQPVRKLTVRYLSTRGGIAEATHEVTP